MTKLRRDRENHEEKTKKQKQSGKIDTKTFVTATDGGEEDITFYDSDVPLLGQKKAHKDAINYITWVPELQLVASCSFDCNVYIWSTNFEK